MFNNAVQPSKEELENAGIRVEVYKAETEARILSTIYIAKELGQKVLYMSPYPSYSRAGAYEDAWNWLCDAYRKHKESMTQEAFRD